MITLILRRLWTAIPTLFVVIALSFILMRIAPGGPFDGERPLDPATREALTAAYGLNLPLHEQFFRYIGNLAQGDFGPSLVYRDFTVTDLVAKGLPVSLTLGALALVLALTIGISSGLYAASHAGRAVDRFSGMAATILTALPTFVTAPLLVLIFGLSLGWLPVSGWNEGAALNMILPVIALARGA